MIDKKIYAAIYYALGRARGMLYDTYFNIKEKVDEKKLKGLIDNTSTIYIANALKLTEDDVYLDYEKHLTKDEIDKLSGFENKIG